MPRGRKWGARGAEGPPTSNQGLSPPDLHSTIYTKYYDPRTTRPCHAVTYT